MDTDEGKAKWEENLRYSVQEVDGEIGHGQDFTILCNNKRFVVAVRPGCPPDNQITPLLSRYSNAIVANDEEELQRVQDEIDEIIYEAGWRIFAHLATAIEKGSPRATITLHSGLKPETFYFRLVVVRGKPEIVQESPRQPKYVSFQLTISNVLNLSKYSARDIHLLSKLPGIGYVAKVSANGQDMCCKIATPVWGSAVQREYECLQKIKLSEHASSIKAPKLTGFVVDDDGIVIGILEEFISNKNTLGRIKGGIVTVRKERREKWAKQIRQAVSLLHQIGVVWGDGKPENVLINAETDDVWLVDFRGSFTDGWVDAELKETCEGDEQAVGRIVDFLAV